MVQAQFVADRVGAPLFPYVVTDKADSTKTRLSLSCRHIIDAGLLASKVPRGARA